MRAVEGNLGHTFPILERRKEGEERKAGLAYQLPMLAQRAAGTCDAASPMQGGGKAIWHDEYVDLEMDQATARKYNVAVGSHALSFLDQRLTSVESRNP